MSQAQLYLNIAVWSQVASSIFFIAALGYIWYRWLLPVLLEVQARSNQQIAQAEHRRDEVRASLDALRAEIDSAHRDAELIGGRAQLQGSRERDAATAEARDAGERALRDAAGALERARRAARRRLRDELLARALEIARSEATDRFGPLSDANVVERYAGTLEAGAHG